LNDLEKKVTQSELLANGWTRKLIQDFLPEPELKRNPHYKRGPQMKLWSVSDVESVMQTKEFQEAKEKADKRKMSAQKAVITKTDKLLEDIEKKILEIEVVKVNDKKLRKDTLAAKEVWYMVHDIPSDVYSVDAETMNRWIVNYIRHNLTSYDEELYLMSGKVGCHIAYVRYKNAVLHKIAEVYPKYAEECSMQAEV